MPPRLDRPGLLFAAVGLAGVTVALTVQGPVPDGAAVSVLPSSVHSAAPAVTVRVSGRR